MSATSAPQSDAVQPALQQIVFIDTSIQDYQSILAGIAPGTEIVLIDGRADGLAQIADVLAGRSGIDAVHIFSHGSGGHVDLGSTHLDAAAVGAYGDALATIGRALSADADILLYGCDVGSGARGAALLDALAQATGANIAASTDLTGNSALGGDWVLERSTGTIEAGSPFAGGDPEFAGTLYTTDPLTFFEEDINSYAVSSVTVRVGGADFTLAQAGNPDDGAYLMYENGGVSAFDSATVNSYELVIKVENAYTFDLNGLSFLSAALHPDGSETAEIRFTATLGTGEVRQFTRPITQFDQMVSISDFGVAMDNIKELRLSTDHYVVYNNFDITDVKSAFSDQTPPTILSVSIPDQPMKIGDVVTATIKVAADSDAYTLAPGSTIGGYALGGLHKLDDSTWTATFTITEGSADVAAGAGIPVNLILRDSANNASAAYTAPIAQANDAIDANRPAGATVRLGSGADSGWSSTDGVTRLAQPALAGTAEANGKVSVEIDGAVVAANISVDAGGNWSYLPGTALSDGAHTIRARALDAAGNAGGYGDTLSITIDTSAPTNTASAAAFSSDTGSAQDDLVTNVAAQTISGALSAPLAEDERVMVSLDNGANWQPASTSTGSSGWTLAGQTLVSSNTMQVKVVDRAGNDGPVKSYAYVLDTTAPAVVAGAIAISADSGSSGTDFRTNASQQTVSATLSGALADGDIVYGSLDGGATWTDIRASVSGSAISWATTLRAGSNELAFKIVDKAGNAGSVTKQAYTLDTVAPAAGLLGAAFSNDSGASSTDLVTRTAAQTVSGTLSADLGDGDRVLVSLDNGASWTAAAIEGPRAWSLAGRTLAGSDTLLVKVVDAAGNEGQQGSRAYVLDTSAPAIAAGAVSLSADSGSSATDFVTRVAAQSVGATLSAGLAAGESLFASADGGEHWTDISAMVDGTAVDWTGATLKAGANTLQFKVVDLAGNEGPVSNQSYTLDTVAPAAQAGTVAFSHDSGESGADLVTNVAAQTLGGTLDRALDAGDRVRVSLDNGANWAWAEHADGAAAWSLGAQVLSGGNTLLVQVVDRAGNEGAAAAHAYVFDTSGPSASVAATAIGAGSDVTTARSSETGTVYLVKEGLGITSAADLEAAVQAGTATRAGIAAAAADSTIGTAGLAVGSYRLYAVDKAGNVSEASSNAVTLLAAPDALAASVRFSNDSGASSSDFVTRIAPQHISGTLSAATVEGERVEVSFDGQTWQTATNAVGTTGWSLDGQLASGSGTLHVRVSNAVAGSRVLKQDYVLDTVAPAARTTGVTFSNDSGASSTDLVTRVAAQTIEGSPSSELAAGDSVWVSLDNGATFARAAAPGARAWSLTGQVLQGSGTLQVKVVDLAGNEGEVDSVDYQLDTVAPTVTIGAIGLSADTGASSTDFVTSAAAQTVGATLSAALAPGETLLGSVDGGQTWTDVTAMAVGTRLTWTGATLAPGGGVLQLKVVDLAGNNGAVARQDYTLDTGVPAAPGAPLLAAASDSGIAGDRITNVPQVVLKGTAEAFAEVTLYDSDGSTVIGSAQADAGGAWQVTTTALADGQHTITVRQADRAGNLSAPGAALALTIDTVAPSAPPAPALAGGSSAGANPVIEGTAEAHAMVTLYDGASVVGKTQADAAGKWSVATALGGGNHSLTAVQADVAGNVSTPSAALALAIQAPVQPSQPAPLVDGMPVQVTPVSLPGGVAGTSTSVPIVGAGRTETSGAAGVADIPLASSGGANLLLAQLGTGYGLSSNGANVAVASGLELLIASIKAATPSHAAADQGHLTANGQAFLDQLDASGSLLVQTVKPVSNAAAQGALTLSGQGGAGQSVALVIDTGGLAAGSAIELKQVNFAAIIGSADVIARSGDIVLSGDAAGQNFSVAARSSSAVFAGDGNDTLGFAAPASGAGSAASQARAQVVPSTAVATLHGGQASDTAVFSGARADYDVEVHNGYVVVSDRSATGSRALVVNVEQLQFGDGAIAVEQSTAHQTVAGLYQNILGRQADLYGFEFWGDRHDDGMNWGAIALDMIGSAEREGRVEGFNGNAAHDIAVLYQALFNRSAEDAGLAYWQGRMAQGVTLEQVATSFVESVEMVGYHRPGQDWDFLV